MNEENLKNNSEIKIESNETNFTEVEPQRSTRTKKTKTSKPAMSDQDRKIVELANRGFDVNRIAAMLMVNSNKVREVIKKY